MTGETGFENGDVVPITTPEDMDREIVHDALSQQFNYGEIEIEEIRAMVEERIQSELEAAKRAFEAKTGEIISKLIRLMIDAEQPRRTAYQIAYAGGMGSLVGGSASSIAKRFGLSKQAFEQEGDRHLASLDIRKNALSKRAEASESYRKSNFRHQKT